jgi:hypothetical protein
MSENNANTISEEEVKAAAEKVSAKVGASPMFMVTFRAPVESVKEIDAIAARLSSPGNRVTRSDLLNEILAAVISKYNTTAAEEGVE